MINIEQIKKDWEKHFKECTKDEYPNPESYYIKEEWIDDEFCVYLSWDNFDKNNYILICDDEVCRVVIRTGVYRFYKIFSSFYEKLIKEQ